MTRSVTGVARVGIACGLVAGVVFALHLAVIAEVAAAPTSEPGIRSSTWTPLSGIASFLLGRNAVHGSLQVGPVALGLALHLLVAVLVAIPGVLFVRACVGADGPPAPAMALGAAYGLVVEVIALQLIVNPVQSVNTVYDALPSWAWWAGHGVYGAVLGLLAVRLAP